MNKTLIYLIHLATLAFYATAGFALGLSITSTALGIGAGLVVVALMYFIWGRHALEASE